MGERASRNTQSHVIVHPSVNTFGITDHTHAHTHTHTHTLITHHTTGGARAINSNIEVRSVEEEGEERRFIYIHSVQ